MAITATDIKYRLAIVTGTAGNQNAQPNPNASLGKYVSTTDLNTGVPLNNLWDDISGDENAASESEYRCLFVCNTHATLTWQNVVVWIQSETAGGASVAIAVDNLAASTLGSASAQAAQIANEDTAPTGVGAFSSPTTKAAGLALGNIGPGQCRAVWVRRTTANTGALDNDGATLRAAGDTAQ